MTREYLTKRITNGWSTPCGRVRAIRDTSLLDAKRDGAQFLNVTRFTYWDVELLSPDGTEVWDTESVNVLDEADEQAYWFIERINEGRDHPDYDEDDAA